MDSMAICKFLICFGILQQSPFYHVDGILFQVPEMVEWSRAENTCQKYRGKLLKPNETSFDVTLFRECNFKEDLWVAATYINIINFESASRMLGRDSVIKCEMCTIGESCITTCSYKSCGSRCSALCEHEPHTHFLSDIPYNWTDAMEWCTKYLSNLGDKIQNATSLFNGGYCNNGCFWTNNLIRVQFQTKIAPANVLGECGILHNGTLSFTYCNRQLHPLCERVANSASETPRPFVSAGSNSCILMNTKLTAMTTTQASRRTNRIHATIKTSSIYAASSVIKDIATSTTIGLNEENSSLLVPVGATTPRNDLEHSLHKSDTGIIIGAITGSFVFLMMTVLSIICFRRRLLQRTGDKKSKHDRKNMKMTEIDTTDPNQCHDVRLEIGSGFTLFAELENNCEGSHSGIFGQISNPGKPASMLDPEGSEFNYETLTKKVNVNSSYQNSNINYDGYDHLNRAQEGRDDNVTGNVYDTVNFE